MEQEEQVYPEELFLNTPTAFSQDSQNISMILEEFLFELNKILYNIDRTKYSYLVERFPDDEMKIFGPIQVMFKPLKIVGSLLFLYFHSIGCLFTWIFLVS